MREMYAYETPGAASSRWEKPRSSRRRLSRSPIVSPAAGGESGRMCSAFLPGCLLIVNCSFLTTANRSVSVLSIQRVPRSRGSDLQRRGHMSRNALYAKFVLLVLVLGTVAMFLGSEPWGPN